MELDSIESKKKKIIVSVQYHYCRVNRQVKTYCKHTFAYVVHADLMEQINNRSLNETLGYVSGQLYNYLFILFIY